MGSPCFKYVLQFLITMLKSISKLFIYLFLAFLIACEDNEPANNDLPANLEVDVVVADDGTGNVDVDATADNTTEYHFYMGDAIDADPIINTTGQITYTYDNSGVYVIETRAYGSSGKFIKTEVQISVLVDNGEIPDDGYTTPPVYEGMSLLWSDEFNGTRLNETDWTYEIGNGSNGWGNNELQYYRRENTSVSNGYLTIEARDDGFSNYDYTSSRIITKDKVSFKYGRIDIRAKLPKGQGLWPALWMLGSNFEQVGWPACGEIDIMELVGHEPNVVHGTVHYGPPWPNNKQFGTGYTLSSGNFNQKFHVFTLVWYENKIEWFVDDVLYFTLTPANISPEPWLFNANFFFIFNVAVGGNWPGSPNSSTVFPQQMVVDYVRVFQPN